MLKQSFTKDNGVRLPVSDEYLVPLLNPTSKGTQYWESPPEGVVLDRHMGRMLLQAHQILGLMAQTGFSLSGKSMLDIGTGNGMIPRLLLALSELESAVGSDPYLDGEHRSSWQKHDHDETIRNLCDFVYTHCPNVLDFDSYKHLVNFEHFELRPVPVPHRGQPPKRYRFAKMGAHDLEQVGQKFDFFYAKSIEHIQDWDGIFRAVSACANTGAVFCLKHASFFSYLGPHRYASTNIPWGHLLLTDAEYPRFAQEFHAHRADQMIAFYFNGLSHPRTTISGLMRIAARHNFVPRAVINEPLRNVRQLYPFIEDVPGFWELVSSNYAEVSFDEMLSGRYHILLQWNSKP